MKLQLLYKTKQEIPAGMEVLYEEKDGEWCFAAIDGVKTQADIDKLNEALRKERSDHKISKDKLKTFGDMTAEQVQELKDDNERLKVEVETGGKGDKDAIDKLVEARVKQVIGRVERERDTAIKERDESRTENESLKGSIASTSIKSALQEAAIKGEVLKTAIADVLMYEKVFEIDDDGKVVTRDGVGVTPGLEVSVWLSDMKNSRSHWWPGSQGAGAGSGKGGAGDTGDNPWSDKFWNMTKQGHILKTDPNRAKQLAASAGKPLYPGGSQAA